MKNDEDVTWARVEFGLNFQLVNPLVLRAKNAQNGQNRTGRNPGLRVYSKFQFKSVFSVQGVRGLSGNPTMMIGGGTSFPLRVPLLVAGSRFGDSY